MKKNNAKPILIFTGGHHSSALAVANYLRKHDWSVVWLGHRYSQWKDRSDSAEYREVTSSGIPFYDLKAGKAYRTYHPLKLFRIPWGFIQAFWIIFKLKRNYKKQLRGIVSFGGYLAVPVVICGWILSVPSITHEQTISAGWANKIISKFARKIAVTWRESVPHFPSSKVVLTGLPFRQEVLKYSSSQNRSRDNRLIYITGGKQGSHLINRAVFSVIKELLNNYQVVHQTGGSSVHSDFQIAQNLHRKLPKDLKQKYEVSSYYSAELAARYLTSAGVVVSRSGAHITSELLLLGTRCVLIPISWSSHSEQQKNAQLLAQNNQAIILAESELNGQSLIKAIQQAQSLHPSQYPVITDALEKLSLLIESEFTSPHD